MKNAHGVVFEVHLPASNASDAGDALLRAFPCNHVMAWGGGGVQLKISHTLKTLGEIVLRNGVRCMKQRVKKAFQSVISEASHMQSFYSIIQYWMACFQHRT